MAVDIYHRVSENYQSGAEVGMCTIVRMMKTSSHPGSRRMINRVYSLSKQHIQEKICRES